MNISPIHVDVKEMAPHKPLVEIARSVIPLGVQHHDGEPVNLVAKYYAESTE